MSIKRQDTASTMRGAGRLWMLFLFCAIFIVGGAIMSSCHHHVDEIEPDPEPDPVTGACGHVLSITLPQKNFTLTKDAGSSQFFVMAEPNEDGACKWTVSIDSIGAKWLHLDVTEGTGDMIVPFSYDENTGTIKRSARITVTDTDGSGLERQLLIRQSIETNSTMTGTMEAKHGMGYGYDISGYYSSDQSYGMKPIIDYSKAVKLEKNRGISIITEDYRHYEEVVTSSGNTYTELANELTSNIKTGGKFGFGTTKEIKNFSRTKKRNNQIAMYVRLNEVVSSRSVDMGSVKALMDEDPKLILNDNFIKDLNTLSTDADYMRFIMTYGTHFIVSAGLGGSLSIRALADRDSIFTHKEITSKAVRKFLFIKGTPTEQTEQIDNVWGNLNVTYTAQIEGGSTQHRDQILSTVQSQGTINTSLIHEWQKDFLNDDGTLNADNISLVDRRLIPLYELVPSAEKQTKLREMIISYLKLSNTTCAEINEDEGFLNFSSDDLSGIQDTTYLTFGMYNETSTFMVAREYVSAVREDQTVLVAYPMVNGRPFLDSGLFLGDKDHRPGQIRWYQDGATYTPDDSICCTDSRFAHLFDQNGRLRRIYYYFHDVHILPSENIQTFTSESLPFKTGNMGNYVKIGRLYWMRVPSEVPLKERIARDDYRRQKYFLTYTQYLDMTRLPSWDDFKHLLKVAPYEKFHISDEELDFTRYSMVGIHWLPGYYYTGSKAIMSKSEINEYYYMPTNHNGELRLTFLSPSGAAPCYPLSFFVSDDTYDRIGYAPIYIMRIPKP